MKFNLSIFLKILFITISSYIDSSSSSTSFSTSILTIGLTIAGNHIQCMYCLPFDFLWRNNKKSRKEESSSSRPFQILEQSTEAHTPIYYKYATNLMDWAFNELDESEEEKGNPISGRYDVDAMESSESEEEDEIPTLDTMADKIAYLRKGRLGAMSRESSKYKPIKVKDNKKPDSEFHDDELESVEKASLPELKQMLDKMKKEDEGSIFGYQIFNNPITSGIMSFGTNIFKKMYCGVSPRNNYCISDQPMGSLFNSNIRRI